MDMMQSIGPNSETASEAPKGQVMSDEVVREREECRCRHSKSSHYVEVSYEDDTLGRKTWRACSVRYCGCSAYEKRL